MKKSLLIFAISLLGMLSCTKNDTVVSPKQTDVYVAGYDGDGNTYKAKIWKNG